MQNQQAQQAQQAQKLAEEVYELIFAIRPSELPPPDFSYLIKAREKVTQLRDLIKEKP